jgi:hypothetical protein
MPNQRAKNKVLLGAFVDVQVKNQVLHLARTSDKSISQILIEALQEYVVNHQTRFMTEVDAEPTEEIWRL